MGEADVEPSEYHQKPHHEVESPIKTVKDTLTLPHNVAEKAVKNILPDYKSIFPMPGMGHNNKAMLGQERMRKKFVTKRRQRRTTNRSGNSSNADELNIRSANKNNSDKSNSSNGNTTSTVSVDDNTESYPPAVGNNDDACKEVDDSLASYTTAEDPSFSDEIKSYHNSNASSGRSKENSSMDTTDDSLTPQNGSHQQTSVHSQDAFENNPGNNNSGESGCQTIADEDDNFQVSGVSHTLSTMSIISNGSQDSIDSTSAVQ